MHRSCYHWRPCVPVGCRICLEQSAGVSSGIANTASFLLGLSVRDVSTALTLLRDTSYCYVSLQFLGLYDTIVIRHHRVGFMLQIVLTFTDLVQTVLFDVRQVGCLLLGSNESDVQGNQQQPHAGSCTSRHV